MNNKKYNIIILIVSLVCLYTICAVEFPLLRILPGIEPVEKYNNLFQNLSYSFLAGAFFYYLSVYMPFQEKKGIIKYHIMGYISEIRDTSFDFFYSFIGKIPSKNNMDELLNVALAYFRKNGNSLPNGYHQIFIDYYRKINNSINQLAAYHDFLDEKQLNKCNEINNSYFFNIIRDFTPGPNSNYVFSVEGYKNFVKSAINNYYLMDELYIDWNRSIFKEKKSKKKSKS